jgi:hypothetical protein
MLGFVLFADGFLVKRTLLGVAIYPKSKFSSVLAIAKVICILDSTFYKLIWDGVAINFFFNFGRYRIEVYFPYLFGIS